MAVRSRRLWGPLLHVAGTTTSAYIVPAGRTAVLRSLVIANTAGSGAVVVIITPSGGTAVGLISISMSAPSDRELFDWVLNPGDTLSINPAAGMSVRTAGFGSLLEGAPE